jgi:hypothetical protein
MLLLSLEWLGPYLKSIFVFIFKKFSWTISSSTIKGINFKIDKERGVFSDNIDSLNSLYAISIHLLDFLGKLELIALVKSSKVIKLF